MTRLSRSSVMAGLVPAIHAFRTLRFQDVDTRDKPGHDERVACHGTRKVAR
jgi:hypothetical protein